MACLSSAPDDIIMLIAETCPRISEIAALARTSSRNYSIVNPILYKIMNRKYPSHRRNPLFRGIESGVLATVRLALQYGASPNTLCLTGAGPISLQGPTAQGWMIENLMGDYMVKYKSSLHIAAERERVDIANYLLDHGMLIDLCAKDICKCQFPLRWNSSAKTRVTALHTAICHGKKDMALLLINRGANVKRTCWDPDVTLFRPLISIMGIPYGPGPPFRTKLDDAKVTALHTAAAEGMVELFVPILAADPTMTVNDPDLDRCTAVHWACLSSTPDEVIKALVQMGADVNIEGKDGCSPLNLACYIGNYAAAVALAGFGANVNNLWDGRSPLHSALLRPGNYRGGEWRRSSAARDMQDQLHQSLVDLLLSLGADASLAIDMQNTADVMHEHTPLTIAALMQRPVAVLKALLDGGASVNDVGPNGRTALQFMLVAPDHPLTQHMRKVKVLTRRDIPAIVYLIKRGSSLAMEDDDGSNALSTIVSLDDRGDRTAYMFSMLNEVLGAASSKELPQYTLDEMTQQAFDDEDWDMCGFLHCVWGGRLRNEFQSQQVAFQFDHDKMMKMVNDGIQED